MARQTVKQSFDCGYATALADMASHGVPSELIVKLLADQGLTLGKLAVSGMKPIELDNLRIFTEIVAEIG